jgi:hypothetical protein
MMRRAVAIASLAALLALPVLTVGATDCPSGWTQRFSARESELNVIVLPEGMLFCAQASTGFVSGVIRANGKRTLDSYLPEDDFWRVFGPPNATPTPRPTPRPTSPPGSATPTPKPAVSQLPNAAMEDNR